MTSLDGDTVEHIVVRDDGVVKIKPDDHANKKFKRKIFKSR
jgi:hypothetical protein